MVGHLVLFVDTNICMVNATREDYIRAIYLLGANSPVGVTDIATRLNLSKSTVSERVKALVADGLVKSAPYGEVTLTKAGEKVAVILTYKHRLLEVFLHKTLGMHEDSVHEEAEKLEHAVSDEVIQKLAKFLGYPTSDPHGTPIETPEGW